MLKKTNYNSMDKYVYTTHGVNEAVINTDETGGKELIVFDTSTVWSLPLTATILVENALGFSLDGTDPESKQSQETPKDNKVTEDFTLKLASMLINKEKYSDQYAAIKASNQE